MRSITLDEIEDEELFYSLMAGLYKMIKIYAKDRSISIVSVMKRVSDLLYARLQGYVYDGEVYKDE